MTLVSEQPGSLVRTALRARLESNWKSPEYAMEAQPYCPDYSGRRLEVAVKGLTEPPYAQVTDITGSSTVNCLLLSWLTLCGL